MRPVPPVPPASAIERHRFEWHGSGRSYLDAQLRAIGAARRAVRMEMYIFSDTQIGTAFRDALTQAARRGVAVQLLLDGVGSGLLGQSYFSELTAAGGQVVWFNSVWLGKWTIRNHRKLLLVDETLAFVGGCNISDEYHGDGVSSGWRDGGVAVAGPVVNALGREFEEQWQRAERRQWQLVRGGYARTVGSRAEVLALFTKPGLGLSPLRAALREDLRRANDIAITSAYFLPTRRLRAQLLQAHRRGARLRLLLAAKSDVRLMLLATQSLYRGILRSGIELFEYQPQVLHAKTMVLDDIVYVGSSNLDPRSLRINFEVMLRIKDAALAAEARRQFETDLAHSTRVTLADTAGFRSWLPRMKQRLAYFILAKLDPWVAREQLKTVKGR